MRIGILSDIHVDLNSNGGDGVTPALIRAVEQKAIEVLIVAGDVADDFTITVRTMERIRKRSGVRCLFVPGNHDIWNANHPEMDSWEIYEALKEIPGNLAAGAQTLTRDWLAIGDLGWYDYSFGAERYSIADFDRMQFGQRVWQDSIKARWGMSSRELHRFFYEKLERQLQENRAKRLIVVTHVLPIREFTVLDPDEMWSYLNAFLGSREYGQLIARQPGVGYSISGHVHYRRRKSRGKTQYICNCLGYTDQWKSGADPSVEVPAAVVVIEI